MGPPADLDELQRQITAGVDIFRQDRALIRHAVNIMLKRAKLCIHRVGGHVEDQELIYLIITTLKKIILSCS